MDILHYTTKDSCLYTNLNPNPCRGFFLPGGSEYLDGKRCSFNLITLFRIENICISRKNMIE